MTQSTLDAWRGEVAVVTGATSGIGAAIARALVGEGLRVVGMGRRAERLDALRDELGESFVPRAVDLRATEALAQSFVSVKDELGPVRVLINNAGLGHEAPLLSGDTEQWREMLEVNVLALCVCTREAVAQMRASGDRGHVVHIGSMAGHRVPPGSGVYSASKYAVRSLTEGLRGELRAVESDIRVSEVSPGFVETEFAAKFHRSEEAARETYGRYPVLQPDDVARTVVHLVGQPPHVQIHDVLMRPTRQGG